MRSGSAEQAILLQSAFVLDDACTHADIFESADCEAQNFWLATRIGILYEGLLCHLHRIPDKLQTHRCVNHLNVRFSFRNGRCQR